MDEPFVCIFDFNEFSKKNPIVEACIERTKSLFNNVHVYNEHELMGLIMKLPHSKYHFEKGHWSFVGDQLRLYLATQHENFLYVDADVYIKRLSNIKPNMIGEAGNEGTFFWKVGNNEFVNHYLQWYFDHPDCEKPNIFCHQDGFFDMKVDRSTHTCYHFHSFELQKFKIETLPECLRAPFAEQLKITRL